MSAALAKDDRKFIPVSSETHRRVVAYAGWLTSKTGVRASMDAAIVEAMNVIESNQATTQPETVQA